MNWVEAFQQARKIGEQARLSITIVSNQSNGLVGYIQGTLHYHPEQKNSENLIGTIVEYFSTGQDNPLLEVEVTPASINKPQLHNVTSIKDAPGSPQTAIMPISTGAPLHHLFSDRQIDLNTIVSPSSPPPFGSPERMQPFYVNSSDMTGITLSGLKRPSAKITLHSWDDSTFMINFVESQGIYVGTVVPVDSKHIELVYLLSLNRIWKAPLEPH